MQNSGNNFIYPRYGIKGRSDADTETKDRGKMKLLPKLMIILLFVTIIPLSVSTYFSINIGQEEVIRLIEELHIKSSLHLAEYIDNYLIELVKSINLSLSYLKFDRLDESEKIGALRIIYSQFEPISIVSLLTRQGEEIVPSVYLEDPDSYGQKYSGRLPVNQDDLNNFAKNIPFQSMTNDSFLSSPVYSTQGKTVPCLALAFQIKTDNPDDPWILALELSLKKIQDKIGSFSIGKEGLAYLIDDHGRIISHPRFQLVREKTNITSFGIDQELIRQQGVKILDFTNSAGFRLLGAWSSLTSTNWKVIVEQPSKEAFNTALRLKKQTFFWVGVSLIVAILTAVIFAQSLSKPVQECSAGAREVAKGNFNFQLDVQTRDEIGDLARAFNYMGQELKKSNMKIAHQSHEIQRWNIELQDRVEDRTRELKETQAELIQVHKMAAVGQLGAGIAHELNNPLTGILGFAQLQLMKKTEDDSDYKAFRMIETEAHRCKDIINNLLIFSHEDTGTAKDVVPLQDVIKEVLTLTEGQLSPQKITVEQDISDQLPAIQGNRAQLKQVLVHLLTNARNAMPNGGIFRVSAHTDDEMIILKISDTGKGIPANHQIRIFEPFFTTKDNWKSKGMGLAIVYRIIENHCGTITVQSATGKGTTFTLCFPAVSWDQSTQKGTLV